MNVPTLRQAVPKRGNFITKALGRGILTGLGWRFEGEVPNRSKFVAAVAPHTSTWDAVVTISMIFAIGIQVSWLGTKQIFRGPGMAFFRWLGGIPIDRQARHGVVEQTIAEFGQREHFVLALFPEGTRKKTVRWKTGFYHIAQGAGVPILLVGLDYGRNVIRLGPLIMPGGDLTADLQTIQHHFSQLTAKNPHRFSTPHSPQ